ncbi:MAG: class I adenylate-forming enzyme family protein [Puniceicoccales bacterium]
MILSDLLAVDASRADRVAVADGLGQLTYHEITQQAACVASWLMAQGVQPGDRVFIELPNSTRFVAALFGAQFAGAVTVPLDPALAVPQLDVIAASAEPKVRLSATSPWEEIFASPPLAEAVRRDAGELAALMFTTGTTGTPKGVMLSHANIFAALRNISAFIGYSEHDREVITLPLSHNFGLGHLYCNLLAGGAAYLEPGLSRVGRALKAVRDFGATGFPTTPLGVSMLLDRYADVFAERARGLRFMVVNSAPLPPERTAQLQALLPELDIMVYYGLTEASRSTFVSLTQVGPDRYRSVGRSMKGVNVRLDEVGQVLVSGPTVSTGYWRAPEQTDAAFLNGELHTGDLGRFDEEGYLFITGRQDDTINLGGYKINPLTVERVLEAHSSIRECAVTSVDDTVVALVATDAEPDTDVLIRYCREHLQVHEAPTRFVRVDQLPRTDSGKLRRKELLSLLMR